MAGPKIVIEDLLDPMLTDSQRALLESAERDPVQMSVEAVLSAASERVHLDDFGADDFLERLALILDEAGSDDGATELNKAGIYHRSVRQVATRLLVVELLKRHPEIHDEPIEGPIVIGGLPRSGTTHLLELIAADRRLQSLPYWQALEPLPLPGEPEGPAGSDPRWLRCQAGWEMTQAINPYSIAQHPMNPDHTSEDGELQLPDFASYTMEFAYRAPRWRDRYLATDQTPHYAYQNTLMKVLQWQRGERKRWVVKAPQHIEQLGPILNVWPDATVAITHRDPIASLQSIVTGFAYIDRLSRRTPDWEWTVAYWSERNAVMLERYLRDRAAVPEGQLVDVLFAQFVPDNLAAVQRIYAAAGLELTQSARADLAAYSEGHRQHRHGAIDYDLRRNFGLEPADLRRRYDFYLESMPLAVEVH